MSRLLLIIVVFKLCYLQYSIRHFFGSGVERVAFYSWVVLTLAYVGRAFLKGMVWNRAMVRVLAVFAGYIAIGSLIGFLRGNVDIVLSTVTSYVPVLLLIACLSISRQGAAFSPSVLTVVSLIILLSVPVFYGLEIELKAVVKDQKIIDTDFYYYVSRASGFYANPNKAAQLSNLVYALVLTRPDLFWRKLIPVLQILCGATILMTMSKSGMLVFTLLSILSFFSSRRHWFGLGIMVLGGILAFSVIGFDVVQSTRLEDMQKILSFRFDEVNMSERDTRSARAFGHLLKSPWGEGLGFNNFVLVSHNEYLRFFIDLGLLLGSCFTILLGGVVSPLLRSKYLLVVLVCYCAISQSIWNREEIFIFFYLFNLHVESSKT